MPKYFRSKLCPKRSELRGSSRWWQRLFRRHGLLNVALFVLAAGLGVLYLVQINQTATSGFALKDMNAEILNLSEEHQNLELKLADLQSLKSIRAASERLQLVAQTRLEYLNTSAGAVALER